MSWVVEEWKEGLSTRVLHKIQELESHLEKLKKERQQRQFQLESLEAALQKQKQKVENEKNEGSTLKRENQTLMELCESLEKTKQKLSHELQVKESQVSLQEGQLISSKKQIESQHMKSQDCTIWHQSHMFSHGFYSALTDSESEELQVKCHKEIGEKKRLETEWKIMKSQVTKINPLHPENTISRREIARQQASSSVFSWQQEKTPSRASTSCQETPLISQSATSHFPWESGATPSHKDLNSAKKEFTNCSVCKDSPLVHQMKMQNQELRSRVQELDHKLQIQAQEMKSSITKLQETQLQLESMKMELTEKDKAQNKTSKEITRIATQLDQALGQLAAKEEKVKRLSDELNCQRQNSESAQCSLQQKIKEREKEHQEVRFSTLSEKQQLETNAKDFTQKLNLMDQAIRTMQLKENELKRTCEEIKQQNHLLTCQSAQQLQEICQLKDDLCGAKQLLQQSQHFAEDMKNKNCSLETELKVLEEKLKKEDDAFTLKEMKVVISDLEKEQDSLQQLLKHKENIIEELSIKLEDLETLQKGVVECEGPKKEIEVLSQWKEESEQLLNQLGVEKEELMSKISNLERALKTEQFISLERTRAIEVENENLTVEINSLKCMVENKIVELEEHKKAYIDLQQENAMSEEKHRKERENNSLKLSEFTKQVDVLEKKLQSTANEVLDKEKCIAALETSLASHMQLNACLQKQCEELSQARDEIERKLAEAEQRGKDFTQETGQHLSRLQASLSEKQDLLAEVLAALEEKDKQLQALIKEHGQQTEIQDLKINSTSPKYSAQQLKVMSQTISQKEPDLSAEISISKKETEGLHDHSSRLRCAMATPGQKKLSLMQTKLLLSNSLEKREGSFSELSEKQKRKSLLLSEAEGLEMKCMSLEAQVENLEGALREQACHFEVERNEFETQEKQQLHKCEELQHKIVSLEEKNNILHGQLENIQPVPEEAEILGQESVIQNNVQPHDSVWLQENKQLIKELKIRNEKGKGGFPLDRASLESLRLSMKEKEDELNKYQVKLELLQMDLEDKEISVENYADQVKQLEIVLRTMEIKVERSEMEKEKLKHELQVLKELGNPALEIAEEDGNNHSPVSSRAVTKENFNQQIDSKCSSVPPDLTLSQNDYAQLASSLHVTMSMLNELEKMCEHLQTEKSTLASQLKQAQLECITSTDTVAEELVEKIGEDKEKKAPFSVELIGPYKLGAQSDIDQISLMTEEHCVGLDYADLKLTSKQIKTCLDEVKEKALSLKNEYNIFQEQSLNMISKISELQCYSETLKEENTALPTSFNQVSTPSLTVLMTPSPGDENGPNSDKKANLKGTPDKHHNSLVELFSNYAWVFPMKQEHVISKEEKMINMMEHLLCEDYENSFKMIEESFRSHKNLEDEEIQKIQGLLLSAREEIDGLQKQNISDNEKWQQKLHRVILQMASELPDERKAEPQLPLRGLDVSCQPLLCQGNDHSCHLGMNALSSISTVLEAVDHKAAIKPYEENGSEVQRTACEAKVSIKSTAKCLPDLDKYSRNAADESVSHLNCPDELSLPPNHNTSIMSGNFLENRCSSEISQQHIKQAYSQNSKTSHDMEESKEIINTLLKEIQNAKSDLDSKAKELAEKRTSCIELNKKILFLEQENKDLSEALKSVTSDNQQLSYNLTILEIEFKKAKSDLEVNKIRLSDTADALEDLEMTKADWVEKLLEVENDLRKIKSEKGNVERHALSLEADLEEFQSKNELLEKEIENKLKTISGLQEQLSVITAERNQFSQELSTLSIDKEELDQIHKKMQAKIKDLELSQVDSAEFIRILEAEARNQAKLLQATKADSDQLSTEKDCLMLQLQNLDKLVQELALEKEAAQNQMEHLAEEKEVSLRECESLSSKLSTSEMENAKKSKFLEGSLKEKRILAARLKSAQEEVHDLQRGMDQLTKRILSDEKSRQRMAEKLKENERKTDSLLDKIEHLERELQLSEENLENAILQTELAKAETETVTAEVGKLHENLHSLQCEINVLKAEKECLGRELEENRDKVSSLEVSNITLVKQLEEMEKRKVQIVGSYENMLAQVASKLKQICEEMKLFPSKQKTYKAKKEDLINEITSLKDENARLVYFLEEAKCKNSELEQLMETYIQEFQDFEQKFNENDSSLELKNETSQVFPEDPQVKLQKIVQLKEEYNYFCHKFQQWLDDGRKLKQGKKHMVKQIHELETQLKMADEIRLELEGLKESLEEKTTEAGENLEKYCALIINLHKLEEDNEMLRTQVSLLNTQLKQLSRATSSFQSSGGPTKIADELLMEKPLSGSTAAEGQNCQGNRESTKKTRTLPEAVIKENENKTTFHQHGPAGPPGSTEYGSDSFPKTGGKGKQCLFKIEVIIPMVIILNIFDSGFGVSRIMNIRPNTMKEHGKLSETVYWAV
uniref:Centromere protein F n=1 Tax=Varanus komodoensis TaxID=61221 RepID=A0A8D2IIZ9_VARKO